MTISQILTPAIEKAIQALFDLAIDKVEFQATRKEFEGDITMVIFPLLKVIKSNPVTLGNQIGNYLIENTDEVAGFNVVSGFLNIVIADQYYLNFFKLRRKIDQLYFKTLTITGKPSQQMIKNMKMNGRTSINLRRA